MERVVLSLILVAALAACGDKPQVLPVEQVDMSTPEMQAEIASMQAALDEFLSASDAEPLLLQQSKIKLAHEDGCIGSADDGC